METKERKETKEYHIIEPGVFIKRYWKQFIVTFFLSVLLAFLCTLPIIQSLSIYKDSLEREYKIISILWTNIFLWCAYWPAFLWLWKYGTFAELWKEKQWQDLRRMLFNFFRLTISMYGTYEILRYKRFLMRRLFYDISDTTAGSFIQLCIGVLFFVLINTDFKRAIPIVSRWKERYPWLFFFSLFPFTSVICFFNVEMLCESHMQTYIDMRFLNMLYWLILMMVINLLTRRVKISAILTVLISYIVGVANYLVVLFRGNEILWGDITAIQTAMEVVDNYAFKANHYFFGVTCLTIFTLIFILFLPVRVEKKKWDKKRILTTVCGEAAIIGLLLIANGTGILYGNINGNYWDYTLEMANTGYLPYFISNMNCSSNVKLDSYSAKKAKSVLESSEIDSGNVERKENQFPNIIVVMDEAFSDLAVNGKLETNEDYMPFIRSMKKNTIKGNLHLSICGGPTANTEFEFLTRSSLAFLPSGCIPYNQYMKNPIPSLATVLKKSTGEYQTMAFHSHSVTGYNRLKAYKRLGFDESKFVEEEDRDQYDLLRTYVTDQSNFEEVEKLFEEKKAGNPLFLFNVTMQNHGGYDRSIYPDEKIKVSNFDAAPQLETYLSLVKMTDDAVKKLISYFKKEEEPTIIVFFGDHQPKLPDEVLAPLMGEKKGEAKSEDGTSAYSNEISRYQVPFFIWANYDIKEKKDVDISANYLASYMLQTAGVNLTAYDEFLLDMQKSFPVVTAREYWDMNKNRHAWDEKEKISGLNSYENIQYNCIFDEDNKLTRFFDGK